MTTAEIRAKYLEFFEAKGHKVIPRARIVPENDPTTLFTGSGMQPLLPYLLGEKHPKGNKLVNSQTCFRAEDIDEVGDNRHTTFFEMLGNWSLGDYFKREQLPWFFEFLTDVVGLDPAKLYVTVFIGDQDIPKDVESAEIWKGLFKAKSIKAKDVEIGSEKDGYQKGMQGGRVFYYDASKNWWSRVGEPANMPVGEPGGPDSEVFYEFTDIEHNTEFGKHCHPNCDCGRFLEIGNSVFMQYKKNAKGGFDELPQQNVDFGGGLERIAAASIDSSDVFKIDLLKPIIDKLEELADKKYEAEPEAMRVIADHMRSAVFMASDGVMPSNKTQGYILRRLLRRAIRQGLELGIENGLFNAITPTVISMYKKPFPEIAADEFLVTTILEKEEKLFRQTLRKGLREFKKELPNIQQKLTDTFGEHQYEIDVNDPSTSSGLFKPIWARDIGKFLFKMSDTYGFPYELGLEEFRKWIEENESLSKYVQIVGGSEGEIKKAYNVEMETQRERSRTATKGTFKGGLADQSEQVVKYHTTTHIMYRALRKVLGDHVEQRGSNITEERTRFDFSHHQKMTDEEKQQVEDIVNEVIDKDLPVSWQEMPTQQALDMGARGHFGEKYGDTVKVYTIGEPKSPYSLELCGGPHVEHTGVIGEGGKRFKIAKEESSSAGIRRIKAVLQ